MKAIEHDVSKEPQEAMSTAAAKAEEQALPTASQAENSTEQLSEQQTEKQVAPAAKAPSQDQAEQQAEDPAAQPSEAQSEQQAEQPSEPQPEKQTEKQGPAPASSSETALVNTTEESPETDMIVRTDGKNPENKKRQKLSFVQVIGILCIVVGIIIFLIPYLNDYLIRRYSQLDLSAITAAQMAANAKHGGQALHEDIEEIGLFNVWGMLGKYKLDEIVGELTIPSQHIDLAVFSKATNENLLAGVAPIKNNQVMGEGNYTLSGHRAKGKDVLLHNLMDAQIGDRINLTDKKKIYVYKVVDAIQVDTDAVEMLEDSQMNNYGKKPIISIMTCYYGRSSSRWFIIGTLEKVIPYSPDEMKKGSF